MTTTKLLPLPPLIYFYILPGIASYHFFDDCVIFFMRARNERILFSRYPSLYYPSGWNFRPSYYCHKQVLELWKEDLNDNSFKDSHPDYIIIGDKNQKEFWEYLLPFLQKKVYFKLMIEIYSKDDTIPFAW